jgi:rhombotail lipoprotein
MKIRFLVGLVALCAAMSGCTIVQHAFCAPGCQSQTRNSSSLVNFLYPDGAAPPAANSIPELRVPMRVGLAFLPSQASHGVAALDEAEKQALLERIRQHFTSRKFVSEIVVIPDYYLTSARGFAGLDGVQRLYNVDVMALVSYDQVTHTDDNKLSLGYLTIVGAYILRGSSQDTATLVDLAVVDPVTRSLVLRAGGAHTWHGTSTLIDADRNSRAAGASGFDEATNQMIGNFDAALAAFETDVHAGKANVRIVSRGGASGMTGGGGVIGPAELLALLGLAVLRMCKIGACARIGMVLLAGCLVNVGAAASARRCKPWLASPPTRWPRSRGFQAVSRTCSTVTLTKPRRLPPRSRTAPPTRRAAMHRPPTPPPGASTPQSAMPAVISA